MGYYKSVVVGAVYNISSQLAESQFQALHPFLAACVEKHPILSAVIQTSSTGQSAYHRVLTLKLSDHIRLLELPDADSDEDLIKRATSTAAEVSYLAESPQAPLWKVWLVPMTARQTDGQPRVFVIFSYSHAIGDGASGLAFHRTFLQAANDGARLGEGGRTAECPVKIPSGSIAPAVDSPKPLPISWSYLLSVLVRDFSPLSWITGFWTRQTPEQSSQCWTGAPHFFKTFENPDPHTSSGSIEVISVDIDVVSRVLAACRRNQTKFTGLLHQVIISALAKQLQRDGQCCRELISGTPVDLRGLLGISKDDMGVMASIVTVRHPINDMATSDANDAFWHATRETCAQITKAAGTLQDQPIGLLRYVSDMDKWMTDKLGTRRETSYELSNVMAFDPPPTTAVHPHIRVDQMVFAQPRDVTGAAISVNAVSVTRGPLVLTLTWQPGALGLKAARGDVDEAAAYAIERAFVVQVRHAIETQLTQISSS